MDIITVIAYIGLGIAVAALVIATTTFVRVHQDARLQRLDLGNGAGDTTAEGTEVRR